MMLIDRVGEVFKERREVRRFFGRRSIDKSCGEVVHDIDPDGPITDESYQVVETIGKPNFAGEEAAGIRAAELHDAYCARAAISAVFDWQLTQSRDTVVLNSLAAMRKEALGE